MNALEFFSCSGGMAKGFQRAGIHFSMVVDYDEDACASYETNLGHRPVRMDVRDLLRMAQDGWRPSKPIDLLVADPPCTPWSRAGKRLGQADERDMLAVTCDLIRLLRPRAYLIGNVPGLQDSTSWHVVQDVIGGLSREGYCVRDYAQLDAADYGVPQHRIRPFWFGHLHGPCIVWPQPSHCSPEFAANGQLPGMPRLTPWVTCRQALGHLAPEQLGRPVRLRWKDGHLGPNHRPSSPDDPAATLTTNTHGDGALLVTRGHEPSSADQPSKTVRRGGKGAPGGGAGVLDMRGKKQNGKRVGSLPDEPAGVVGIDSRMNGALLVNPGHLPAVMDAPAPTLGAKSRGQSAEVLRADIHHPPHAADEPAMTVRAGSGAGARSALALGPRSKAKRPGRGNRPIHPDDPATTVTASRTAEQLAVRPHHAVPGGDEPARTVTRQDDAQFLRWPWERPSTTVTCRDTIPPPQVIIPRRAASSRCRTP